MNSATGSARSRNERSSSLRRSDADRLATSSPSRSTTPTALTFCSVISLKHCSADESHGAVTTSRRVKSPSSVRVISRRWLRASEWRCRNLTTSSWDMIAVTVSSVVSRSTSNTASLWQTPSACVNGAPLDPPASPFSSSLKWTCLDLPGRRWDPDANPGSRTGGELATTISWCSLCSFVSGVGCSLRLT